MGQTGDGRRRKGKEGSRVEPHFLRYIVLPLPGKSVLGDKSQKRSPNRHFPAAHVSSTLIFNHAPGKNGPSKLSLHRRIPTPKGWPQRERRGGGEVSPNFPAVGKWGEERGRSS